MTEHILVLLVCLAAIVVLAILIYVASRGKVAALSTACEIRLTIQQILANTQKIDNSLRDQRHVLYDAYKRISAVTKGVEKPARSTPLNQCTDLIDPAVSKGVGCGTADDSWTARMPKADQLLTRSAETVPTCFAGTQSSPTAVP